jgi:predicted Na+-dependent transporter
MMWGSYAASGGNVLVSVSVGTLTTMLAILAGEACVLLLLNNAHYRRLGNATTWRDLEPANHGMFVTP